MSDRVQDPGEQEMLTWRAASLTIRPAGPGRALPAHPRGRGSGATLVITSLGPHSAQHRLALTKLEEAVMEATTREITRRTPITAGAVSPRVHKSRRAVGVKLTKPATPSSKPTLGQSSSTKQTS